jgi:hypothetical protein
MLILAPLSFLFGWLFISQMNHRKNELFAPKSYMLNLNSRPKRAFHY